MEEKNIKFKEGLRKTERDRGHESEIDEVLEYAKNEKTQEMEPYKTEIVWQNVAKFVILHALAFYSLKFLPVLTLNPQSHQHRFPYFFSHIHCIFV